MKIVADENIPLLKECFGKMGDVVALLGRGITAADVHDADVLLVRSVTKVDELLVNNTSLKFVATATAGVEHIDKELLKRLGISFFNAEGCNATAVSEYVLSAIDILSERHCFNLRSRTFGIVGMGQVGSRLVNIFQRLGLMVLVTDPLCEKVEGVEYVSLEKLIECCDVISLHTPLTVDGPFSTHHMFKKPELEAMRDGTVLINASRGAVIDNLALRQCLEGGKDLKVVMDVWEHEPDIDCELLKLVDLATPHIAGYSLDGKITGTEMIYKAFCKYFGLPARVRTAAITPIPPLRMMGFVDNSTVENVTSTAIRAVYDIRRDDAWMRQLLLMDKDKARHAFDRMRANYPVRREFSTLRIKLKRCSEEVREKISSLGFNVIDE
ncbi:MAG: 4-phosphoerythronate dehydrogenase PdxB [Candidatus Endonucleobacter sp. (ex Gigantidas childressi)]|nr:4-phosphoerythronate dehydrogenase PdxB [Candidatus Endonucleobacter sp. (ex Gigantidas childressi)]